MNKYVTVRQQIIYNETYQFNYNNYEWINEFNNLVSLTTIYNFRFNTLSLLSNIRGMSITTKRSFQFNLCKKKKRKKKIEVSDEFTMEMI